MVTEPLRSSESASAAERPVDSRASNTVPVGGVAPETFMTASQQPPVMQCGYPQPVVHSVDSTAGPALADGTVAPHDRSDPRPRELGIEPGLPTQLVPHSPGCALRDGRSSHSSVDRRRAWGTPHPAGRSDRHPALPTPV